MTIFAGFDIESTGVDPKEDRIVTFSLIVQNGEANDVAEWMINPGVEIPEGASNVHGITTDVAVEIGADPVTALSEIWNSFKSLKDFRPVILAAYNCPFDLTMLRSELKRYNVISQDSTEVEDLVYELGIIDPLVIDKALDPYRKGSRKLVDVSEHHGFSLTNAHNSTADVQATIHLAKLFMSKFREGTTTQQLMELQEASKAEQAESLSKYFRSQGKEDWQVDGAWPIQVE